MGLTGCAAKAGPSTGHITAVDIQTVDLLLVQALNSPMNHVIVLHKWDDSRYYPAGPGDLRDMHCLKAF